MIKKSRSKIRKNSPKKLAKIQRKLKLLVKEIVRRKYGNICYTCDRTGLAGVNWHTGHMIPAKSCGSYLKWDIRILRPQCYHCNINLGGNGAEFLKRMIIREGQEYVDQIYRDRNLVIKAEPHFEMLVTKYKLILEE